jgi:hypothetical protein
VQSDGRVLQNGVAAAALAVFAEDGKVTAANAPTIARMAIPAAKRRRRGLNREGIHHVLSPCGKVDHSTFAATTPCGSFHQTTCGSCVRNRIAE